MQWSIPITHTDVGNWNCRKKIILNLTNHRSGVKSPLAEAEANYWQQLAEKRERAVVT